MKTIKFSVMGLKLGLVLAAMTLSATHTTFAAEPTTVTVGALGNSATIWPVLVAQKKGYFKEAGIEVDLIQTGSSAKTMQQAAAGAIEIGNASTFDAFRAIDAGAGIKIFMSSQAVATHMLFAASSIGSLGDLKGKRVMTGGAKDITNLWWSAMARKFSIDPNKDVDLLFSGATSARYAALVSGGVEAAVLAVPQTFDAEDRGYKNLGLVAPYLGEVPTNVWVYNSDWAKTHADQLAAFVTANNRAVRFIMDRANKAEAAAILAAATNVTPDVANRTYELCLQAGAFVSDGAIPESGLLKVREILDEAGDLTKPVKPVASFFDGTVVAAQQKK